MLEKESTEFKLNTARSSKDKILWTSLFMNCCTSPSAFCSTWCPTKKMMLRSAIRIVQCWKKKWKMYDKESMFISTGGALLLVGSINWERTLLFFRTHFKPTRKKTHCIHPLPFRNLPLLDLEPTPLSEFLWPSMAGYGIFWNHTIFDQCIRVGQHFAAYWLSVDWVSIKYQLGCRSRTNWDTDQEYWSRLNCCWWSVTNVRACEPEPRVASLFLRALLFFLFIYFLAFSINVNVFLRKWFTLQKKHKFSIFFRAWNSAQVVAVVCWRSVYIQIWMKFWASLANLCIKMLIM